MVSARRLLPQSSVPRQGSPASVKKMPIVEAPLCEATRNSLESTQAIAGRWRGSMPGGGGVVDLSEAGSASGAEDEVGASSRMGAWKGHSRGSVESGALAQILDKNLPEISATVQ